MFLTTMDDFVEMNEAYERYFEHRPARSSVAVLQLPLGALVEIYCVALA